MKEEAEKFQYTLVQKKGGPQWVLGLFLGAVCPSMLKYLLFILDDAAKIRVCFQQRTVQRRRERCRRTALMSKD